MITQERLKDILSYDPEVGEFRWLFNRGPNARYGAVAGSVCHHTHRISYRYIRIDGRLYLAHRLAWLFVHGRWPMAQIDHVDGDGLNNRISNLREATVAENARNRRAPVTNTSGFKGVSWVAKHRHWRARIWIDGRNRSLGCFADPAKAHAAYAAAVKAAHGDFANLEVK